jgi:hypothetical protein
MGRNWLAKAAALSASCQMDCSFFNPIPKVKGTLCGGGESRPRAGLGSPANDGFGLVGDPVPAAFCELGKACDGKELRDFVVGCLF